MKLGLSLFSKTAVLYTVALVLGVCAAWRFVFQPVVSQPQPLEFTTANIIMMVVMFFLFSFVLVRFVKVASFSFTVVLALIIFGGGQMIFSGLVSPMASLLLALLVTVTFFVFPRVISHNIGMIVGIGGVSALLGSSLTPLTAVFVLAGMAVYDIIAVYRTGHMVRLARSMIASGAIFGFIVPVSWGDFFTLRTQAQPSERFMILGSGDIGLPIMLAASMVRISVTGAAVIGAFSLIGLFIMHVIFLNQTERRPMAALPPIATLSIIGFLVATFL